MARKTDGREEFIAWLGAVPGIKSGEPELLYDCGFKTQRQLLDADLVDLVAVRGIGFGRAKEIKKGLIAHISQPVADQNAGSPTGKQPVPPPAQIERPAADSQAEGAKAPEPVKAKGSLFGALGSIVKKAKTAVPRSGGGADSSVGESGEGQSQSAKPEEKGTEGA